MTAAFSSSKAPWVAAISVRNGHNADCSIHATVDPSERSIRCSGSNRTAGSAGSNQTSGPAGKYPFDSARARNHAGGWRHCRPASRNFEG